MKTLSTQEKIQALKLLRSEYLKRGKNNYGLCNILTLMGFNHNIKISKNQREFLRKLIYNHSITLPHLYTQTKEWEIPQIVCNSTQISGRVNAFWRPMQDKKYRLGWIDSHIVQLKKKQKTIATVRTTIIILIGIIITIFLLYTSITNNL